jgi:hypothetical protein
MNNLLRGLIAGYGAKKLGGGCLGTVLVFILIWVALGQCSWSERISKKKSTYIGYVSAFVKDDTEHRLHQQNSTHSFSEMERYHLEKGENTNCD